MKRSVIFIAVLLFSLQMVFCCAEAVEYSDTAELEKNIKNELDSAVDADTRDVLESFGIEDFDFDEIYNVSFESITEFFSDTLKEKTSNVAKLFFELLGVILLSGASAAIYKSKSEENFLNLFGCSVIVLMSVRSVSTVLCAVISTLELSGNFMLSFVPVYTLVISLSGNAASALTYNSLVLAFAELMSAFITSGLSELLGVFFCLGISLSVSGSVHTGRLISAVNKGVSLVLGLMSSLFTGFLGIRNILSVSVDSVSVKGIRFLIGSLIPVVGSSISDAYSSLLGSINLIKGSVAVTGILVITVINFPVVAEALVFNISFQALAFVAEAVNSPAAGAVLRCLAGGLRILLLLCVFEMFILIISTGILLSFKNGG